MSRRSSQTTFDFLSAPGHPNINFATIVADYYRLIFFMSHSNALGVEMAFNILSADTYKVAMIHRFKCTISRECRGTEGLTQCVSSLWCAILEGSGVTKVCSLIQVHDFS